MTRQSKCHLCGSMYCQPPFCRFYRNEQEAREQQEEFNKQWQMMETREADEQR